MPPYVPKGAKRNKKKKKETGSVFCVSLPLESSRMMLHNKSQSGRGLDLWERLSSNSSVILVAYATCNGSGCP